MMEQVTVRIPATSANLGPGFDCLGVALDCHNFVTVARGGPAAGAGNVFVRLHPGPSDDVTDVDGARRRARATQRLGRRNPPPLPSL
jgi:homoserine kinase